MMQNLDRSRIADVVCELTHYPRGQLKPEDALAATGLDSLLRIALIETLERDAGRPFDDGEIQDLLTAQTLSDLCATLAVT